MHILEVCSPFAFVLVALGFVSDSACSSSESASAPDSDSDSTTGSGCFLGRPRAFAGAFAVSAALAFAAAFLGAVSGFFVTLAAVLALFLAAVAGASFAAALEAAAVFLGGISDLGFLIVLMRASLMDLSRVRVVVEGLVRKVAKVVENGRLVLVCGSFSIACDFSFHVTGRSMQLFCDAKTRV